MTQPNPTSFADGDVRIEPGGRAIAVRQLNQPNSWAIISADQGLRIGSGWEIDAIKTWPPMIRTDAAEKPPE